MLNKHACAHARDLYNGSRTKCKLSGSPADKSTWTESLKQVGVYFARVVDDADTLVLKHTNATVTTYGTRTSRKTPVYSAR